MHLKKSRQRNQYIWTIAITVGSMATAYSGDEYLLSYTTGTSGSQGGLALADDEKTPVEHRVQDGTAVLSPAPNTDYLYRHGIGFRVETGPPPDATEAFAILEHLDTNISLMELRSTSAGAKAEVSAEPVAGGACLGTGKRRRAVFRLVSPPSAGSFIEVFGVRSLVGLQIVPALASGLVDEVRNEQPKQLEPRIRLSRPMQLVTTVGADAQTPEYLPESLEHMKTLCPLARVLGFNAVESYVKWNFVEPEKDRFDWSYYDAVVEEARRHGLKWFPLLIVGSAYSLPPWFHDSNENVGFVCLEHGKGNNIQTIFADFSIPDVQRFLNAFGAHYEPTDRLLGVRLGPSGNFGESQYPAGGNWGYGGRHEHIHIGWWAGDPYAAGRFRGYLQRKYPDIAALDSAWDESYASFDEVAPFIAQFAETPRKRKDFVDWYMDAMTVWCEDWAIWARKAMPNTEIYQSSGGWGFVESGTDFTDQAKSMAKIHGGIRATNETDSYAQNFYATRMMTSAARFYGVPFGAEPAGFGSARGVVARLYNILVNDGQHLFYYSPNLLGNDQAVDKWLAYAPLLDRRDEPFIEVAALYPDTMSKLDDAVFRNLYASAFGRQIAELRPKLDFDFCSERMILDGALPRYKVLLFLWNHMIEQEPLDRIDAWVREGGIVFVSQWRYQAFTTVEGDLSVYERWQAGDTGKGRVVFIPDDREPPHRLADAIEAELDKLDVLDTKTQRMLHVDKPSEVYVSVLENGSFALLNYNDGPVSASVPGLEPVTMEPYSIAVIPAAVDGSESGGKP